MTRQLDTATIANQPQELAEIAITDQQAAVIRAVVAGKTQKAAAATARLPVQDGGGRRRVYCGDRCRRRHEKVTR